MPIVSVAGIAVARFLFKSGLLSIGANGLAGTHNAFGAHASDRDNGSDGQTEGKTGAGLASYRPGSSSDDLKPLLRIEKCAPTLPVGSLSPDAG